MTAPSFYIVADGNAYAMEDDGYMFGAPVRLMTTLLIGTVPMTLSLMKKM